MHTAVLQFIAEHRPVHSGDVLDIGGRNINGTPRDLLDDADNYVAVDLYEGDGVDLVGDITELELIAFADTVLCCEVLEHANNWRDIVAAAAEALRPDGLMVITCAGPARAPHSALDGGPVRDGEYYRNLTVDELAEALAACGVDAVVQEVGADLQAWGTIR